MQRKSRLCSLLVLVLVLSLFFPSRASTTASCDVKRKRAAQAQQVQTQANLGASSILTLLATEDATVQAGAPNATDPDGSHLGVGDYLAGTSMPYWADGYVRSYVRFDLSSVPADSTVISATLRMYHSGGRDLPGEERTTTFYRVTGDWEETSITWSTKPDYAEAKGSVDTTIQFSGWVSIDMTAQVRSWLDGSQDNHGLVLIGPEDHSLGGVYRLFFSREISAAPRIDISYRPHLPPVLDVSLADVHLRASHTQPFVRSTIQVSSVTPGALDWSATKVGDASWLTLSRSSGRVTATDPDHVTLTIYPAGMELGSYTEQIHISSDTPDVQASPMTITLRVDVMGYSPYVYLPLITGSGGGGTASTADVVALVVGVSDYQHLGPPSGSDDLPDDWSAGDLIAPAKYDVPDMVAALKSLGVSAENITQLTDGEATRAAVVDALQKKVPCRASGTVGVQSCCQDKTFVLFFSGHGGQTPDYSGDESDGLDEFIALYDTDLEPGGFVNVLTDDDLDALLADLEFERIVILLDSCYSGSMTTPSLAAKGSHARRRGLYNPLISPQSAAHSKEMALSELVGPGRIVVTAGTGDQGTWESGELQNGVFTYFYLQGLQDTVNDANGNGRVSIEEAYWFTRDAVDQWVVEHIDPTPEDPAPHQNPDIRDHVAGQVEFQ